GRRSGRALARRAVPARGGERRGASRGHRPRARGRPGGDARGALGRPGDGDRGARGVGLGPRGRAAGAGGGAMRSLVLLLALLARLAPMGRLDATVQRAVQALRGPALEGPMRAASGIGRPVVVLGALLAAATLGGEPGVAFARETVAALVPANLAVEGIKRLA